MTSIPPVRSEILDFYDQADEAGRLHTTATGRLELDRTRELLCRHLPASPARVLDVGGGPGTHAAWLAEDGYRVHLVDPVLKHVDQAATLPGVTAELGDARHLTAPDGTYDAVLLLGPLYHLTDRADRLTAIAEARRVVRPGGFIAAAAISRYSPLLDYGATGALVDAAIQDRVRGRLDTGQYPEPQTGLRGAFTLAYCHTAADLAGEFTDAGLSDTTVYGIEGPGWPMVKAIEKYTGHNLTGHDLANGALEAARLADGHPGLTDMSAHLLAIAYT